MPSTKTLGCLTKAVPSPFLPCPPLSSPFLPSFKKQLRFSRDVQVSLQLVGTIIGIDPFVHMACVFHLAGSAIESACSSRTMCCRVLMGAPMSNLRVDSAIRDTNLFADKSGELRLFQHQASFMTMNCHCRRQPDQDRSICRS